MRIVGIFALTVGAAMLVGVLPLFIYEHRLQREVQSEVAQVGVDSEDRLGAADPEPLVAREQVALQGWWRPTGRGGTLLMAGVFLMALGWYTLMRAVNASWNLPPLEERYRAHG